MMRPEHPVQVSLGFMPAFFHKHTGVTYGDAYYFDPRHRAEVEVVEGRFLHDVLGHVGVGSADPQPWANIFIQPIDLMLITQGAQYQCPLDATLEAWGTPWAGLSTVNIQHIDAHAAAHHPIIDTVLQQYREIERLYGDRADILSLKSGMMNIHAPYTTAHQLCGEELFYLFADDPVAVETIFAKIWEIYQAIFARLVTALNIPSPTRIYLGDCSSSLLSADRYRESVLPVNQRIRRRFPAAGYHSCGASTHLLPAFAEIPGVDAIELGAGTDLAAAVRYMPATAMCPLVDPSVVRDGTPDEVAALIAKMLIDTADAPAVTLCAWSFDRETPIGNVEAMYRVVEQFRH